MKKVQKIGVRPIILCAPPVRCALKEYADRVFPQLVVLSWNEIAPETRLQLTSTTTRIINS